jgi:hypothetical protein
MKSRAIMWMGDVECTADKRIYNFRSEILGKSPLPLGLEGMVAIKTIFRKQCLRIGQFVWLKI